jgi:C1A family cysteine protease
MTLEGFRPGWIPDKEDRNDLMALFPGVKVQPHSDLEHLFPPVWDQDGLGTCYCFGTIGLVWAARAIQKLPTFESSPLMLSYLVGTIEHSVGQDVGGMPRDAIKSLVKFGVCSEAEWPYNPKNFGIRPPAGCFADAKKHELMVYSRALSLNGIRASLSSGYPCGLGFMVFENFPMSSTDGIIPMPAGSEEGGHYVVIVGHDDAKRLIKFRNSWWLKPGVLPWGDRGYGYLPYDYFQPLRTGDYWIVKRMAA